MVPVGGLEIEMVFAGTTALVVLYPTHGWLALGI